MHTSSVSSGGSHPGCRQPLSPGRSVDRYIRGTRLRLRHTESDAQVVYKFGQEVRLRDNDPEIVTVTNVYLSYEEFAVLASLPAVALCTTRWRVAWEGRTVAVDQFHGRLDGLVLAEVELAPGDRRLGRPPSPETEGATPFGMAPDLLLC